MKKSKNVLFITNFVFLALILIGDLFYIKNGELLTKSITSGLFVALGIINLIYVTSTQESVKKFPIIMAIGLFLAFLGDILLEVKFEVGAAFFALGHIAFFISYCTLKPFKLKDLLYGIAIFIPSLAIILFVPAFDYGGLFMEMVCIVYALIISFMVGKALSNFVSEKTLLNLLVLIGSVLFFFSDFMLLINRFADVSSIFGFLCLISYYPAEFVLAFSILNSKQNPLNIDKK